MIERAVAPENAAGPTILDNTRFSSNERRRVSGPGLRTFNAIAKLWRLSEQERISMLGHPSRSTYYGWLKSVQEHDEITLSVDTLIRISAILGIHKALRILFATEREGVDWLRGAHTGIIFGGAPPLDLMACGTQDGLLSVRRFLDAARGGFYMEPNQADGLSLPYRDEDIVFV